MIMLNIIRKNSFFYFVVLFLLSSCKYENLNNDYKKSENLIKSSYIEDGHVFSYIKIFDDRFDFAIGHLYVSNDFLAFNLANMEVKNSSSHSAWINTNSVNSTSKSAAVIHSFIESLLMKNEVKVCQDKSNNGVEIIIKQDGLLITKKCGENVNTFVSMSEGEYNVLSVLFLHILEEYQYCFFTPNECAKKR